MTCIRRIQAWAFRCPTPQPVATSFGIMHDRPAVFVRLEDDEGCFGWGEIFANWPAAGAEHRVRLLQLDIAPLVLGAEVTSPQEFFRRLEAQTRIRAVQCGEIGPFSQVIAGLDIALWDMAARRKGIPLRQLIDRGAPNHVAAYGSGIQISAADDLLPRARSSGHQTFKLKVGFDMAADIALAHRVNASLTGSEAIAFDANQAWSLEQAKHFARELGHLNTVWIEEPLPVFAEASSWAALAKSTKIPLAGGENIIGNEAFDGVIAAGHLAVIQPDVAKWGGITGCMEVAQQAMKAGRRYCPHFLGGGIGLAASAELLAGVGGDGLLEVDVNDNPLRSMIFDGTEPITNGTWACCEGPGLGIVELPKAFEQYLTLYAEMT